MTQQDYVIARKLNILDFASQMKNISLACRQMGISRTHYYDIKNAIAEDGIAGLLEKTKRGPRIGNRFPKEVEDAILAYSLEFPTHGQERTANELNRNNKWNLSGGGVRSVWLRFKLEKKNLRLKRLEEHSRKEGTILSESQVIALENQKEVRQSEGEIETLHSGFLFGQDTYYVGYIKGVGKIYQQTGIDTFSNLGFAKLYQDKTATVAADFLNDKVLPYFEEHSIRVLRTLTDRGTEYCGNPAHHYQLFLYLNDIEHSPTKARHPQTNGACERLNQIIKDEFYSVVFRRKLYHSIEELQIDLDSFMNDYNKKRTNQGKRCQGQTPYEIFLKGVEIYKEMVFDGKDLAAMGPTVGPVFAALNDFTENNLVK